MSQEISFYKKSPIYYLPSSVMESEIFADITEDLVPGIYPYYMISTYGRIWDKYSRIFVNFEIDDKGYIYSKLMSSYGIVNCRVRRLVMYTFNPRTDQYLYAIEHIDNNKLNCALSNLEYVDTKCTSNFYQNGRLDDQEVECICELLSDRNLTVKEVAEMVGVPYSAVSAIQGKRAYTDISDKYDIKSRKINSNITADEAEALCVFFTQNKKMPDETAGQYCVRALQAIGYSNPTVNQTKSVRKVYWRETYKYVSCKYNF